jgi:hypothetical protein
MNTAEKIKELNEKFNDLQPGFEQDFIKHNAARIAHFGPDAAKFSEKQISIIDKMHKQRIVEGKPFKAAEKAEG